MIIKTSRSYKGRLIALRNVQYFNPKIAKDFFAGDYLALHLDNGMKVFFVILLHSAN